MTEAKSKMVFINKIKSSYQRNRRGPKWVTQGTHVAGNFTE